MDDREPSFGIDVPSRLHYDYLPVFRRPAAWARLELLDRAPFRQLVRALSTRLARKVGT